MHLQIKKKIKSSDTVTTDEIVNFLLKARGIKDEKAFFHPPHPRDISFDSFFSKTAFNKVAKKLEEIYKKEGMIVVYTDYDADGITGGAILWETLHLLGFNTMPYVPHRKLEGYGFSKIGIDNVKKQFDPALIISVDHGIAAADKITYAKSLGIPIVITDHHLKSSENPDDALAIFHTDKFSGAGVAYFFAKEVYTYFKKNSSVILGIRQLAETPESTDHSGRPASGRVARMTKGGYKEKLSELQNHFECDYLALASIGVIADLVPLVGSCRSLAKYGLSMFTSSNRTGLVHILKQAGIMGKPITPYEVGFMIAPRINAIGRLAHAIDALRLLCTTSPQKAFELASKVGERNTERQDLVKKAVEEARRMVLAQKKDKEKIIIVCGTSWQEGIIGLIASKILEEFYRPTIIMTISDGFAKASARSIPGFDITGFLQSLRKYLVDMGGHQAAAGFTIKREKIEKFIKAAEKEAKKLIKDEDLIRKLPVDIQIPLSKATISLVKKLENFEPFGIGNPQPVFYSEAELIDARLFGKEKNHLKIVVKEPDDPEKRNFSYPLEIIFFGEGKRFGSLSRGQKIGVVYTLEIDRWGGRESVRGKGKLLTIKY